jgi:hypothetical protein
VRVMKLDEGDVVTGAANVGQRTEEMERL